MSSMFNSSATILSELQLKCCRAPHELDLFTKKSSHVFPPRFVQLHVSPATDVSQTTRCLCPFHLLQVVQGSLAKLQHCFFVLRAWKRSIHCVCFERLQAHFRCQEKLSLLNVCRFVFSLSESHFQPRPAMFNGQTC